MSEMSDEFLTRKQRAKKNREEKAKDSIAPLTFLVEGKDDEKFLKKILEIYFPQFPEFSSLDNQKNWSIWDLGGEKDLKETLKQVTEGLPIIPALKKIVIVIDRDKKEIVEKIDNINQALQENGFPVLCEEDKDIKTSAFLLPNNKDEGMLETLAIELIKWSDSREGLEKKKNIKECIEAFFKCVSSHTKPDNADKARFTAYRCVISGHEKYAIHALLEEDEENKNNPHYTPFFYLGTPQHIPEALNPLITFLKTLFHETTPPQQQAIL